MRYLQYLLVSTWTGVMLAAPSTQDPRLSRRAEPPVTRESLDALLHMKPEDAQAAIDDCVADQWDKWVKSVRKGEIMIQDKDINKAVLEALLRGQKDCQNSFKAYGVRPSRSGKVVSEGRRRAARARRFNPLYDHDEDDLNLVEYSKCIKKAREEIEMEFHRAHDKLLDVVGKDQVNEEIYARCQHLIKLADHALPAGFSNGGPSSRSLSQFSTSKPPSQQQQQQRRGDNGGGLGRNMFQLDFNTLMKQASSYFSGHGRGQGQRRGEPSEKGRMPLFSGGNGGGGGLFKGRMMGFPQ